MSTTSNLTTPATTAANEPTDTLTLPRIKFSPHGYAIDHPDSALGEALMANALGVSDREAMEGMLRQLVRASMTGDRRDEVNLAFMLSMVNSIKPRDAIEAMLVAQMVSIHVMAMRCAQQLASAEDVVRHDGAARALGRLARTFPAQIDALSRHRSRGEPAITVQNVSVGDGGSAIVGNVTQQRNVIVTKTHAAPTTRKAREASHARHGQNGAETKRDAQS